MMSAGRTSTKGGIVHPSIRRSLKKLGEDIALARRSRRISTENMAQRMGVDRSTLRRLEQGDPGVSLNTFAMALSALDMLSRLTDLVDQASDDIGLMVARGTVAKRITGTRKARAAKDPTSARSKDAGSEEPEGW